MPASAERMKGKAEYCSLSANLSVNLSTTWMSSINAAYAPDDTELRGQAKNSLQASPVPTGTLAAALPTRCRLMPNFTASAS